MTSHSTGYSLDHSLDHLIIQGKLVSIPADESAMNQSQYSAVVIDFPSDHSFRLFLRAAQKKIGGQAYSTVKLKLFGVLLSIDIIRAATPTKA
jgi:hypothetical protein